MVQRCLETLPNGLAGADAPDFVLRMADGSETKLSIASFKEVYGRFRELVRVERQFEAKWENALGIPLRDEWKGIWEALH